MTSSRQLDQHLKILVICNELENLIHHRNHILNALEKGGFTLDIYGSSKSKFKKEKIRKYNHISIDRFKFNALSDLRLFILILIKIIHQKPHAIYLINIKPYLYGSLAARLAALVGWRGRTIVTVPGRGRLYAGNDDPKSVFGLQRKIVGYLLKTTMRHAKVTFETDADRNFWIKSGFISEDQAIVTNGTGVDFGKFTELRSAPTDHLRVLYAGRLLKSKGLSVFVEAAQILRQQPTPVPIELTIAGAPEDDPDAFELKMLVDSPNIRYLGHVNDMPNLLAKTDAVVLPSQYNEGVPRILIEAAATGCLVIATRFPGSQTIIKDNETGLFIFGQNASDLAKDLATKLTDISARPELYKKYGKKAAAHVRHAGFGADEISEKIVKLFL